MSVGLLIALALAVWSALCVLAGGWYVHHRYTPRLARPAVEHGCRRDVEFRKAAGVWQQQIEQARTHTLAVSR